MQRDFITGVFILGPVALTVYLLVLLFRLLDNILGVGINVILNNWLGLNFFGMGRIPGVGFFVLVLLLIATGAAARNVFGRWIIRRSQEILDRIPLVNRVYKAFNQISEAVFSGRRDVFKRAVLVPYPSSSVYSLGIVTSESIGSLQQSLPEESICVFVVSTPNPTTGFIVFVPKKDVIEIDLPVEEALKLIISGGIVSAPTGKIQSQS